MLKQREEISSFEKSYENKLNSAHSLLIRKPQRLTGDIRIRKLIAYVLGLKLCKTESPSILTQAKCILYRCTQLLTNFEKVKMLRKALFLQTSNTLP